MDKREKVIKGLEFCLMPATEEELMSDVCSHDDCPYYRAYSGGKCVNAVAGDALALLKAQEPVVPILDETGMFRCANCKKQPVGYKNWAGEVLRHNLYCPKCGKKVKWE